MPLSNETLICRGNIVLSTILVDARVCKLSTAIKLCRKQLGWLESEDEELRAYVARCLKDRRDSTGSSPHINVMKSRYADRQARKASKHGDS